MNADFYQLLFQSLSKDVDNDVDYKTKNLDNAFCLISMMPLEDNHVTLECGHKFNYTPIFNEIKAQKYSCNYYETQKLLKYQLKCPYCRNVQNSLLPPPYDMTKNTYLHKVNSPIKYCMKPRQCSYIFKSGKNKNQQCTSKCYFKFCNKHKKQIDKQQIEDVCQNNYIETNNNDIYCKAIISSGKNAGFASSR